VLAFVRQQVNAFCFATKFGAQSPSGAKDECSIRFLRHQAMRCTTCERWRGNASQRNIVFAKWSHCLRGAARQTQSGGGHPRRRTGSFDSRGFTRSCDRGHSTRCGRVRVAELGSEPCMPGSAVPLGENIRERPPHGAHRARTPDIAHGRITANFCHIRSTKIHHFPDHLSGARTVSETASL
jgi:hypothetical protein